MSISRLVPVIVCLCLVMAWPSAAQVRIKPVSFTVTSLLRQGQQQRAAVQPRLQHVSTSLVGADQLFSEKTSLYAPAGTADRQGQRGPGSITWTERGPNAFTGTIQALMLPNSPDPTKLPVWAGSASGGLWYNPNIQDPASTWLPQSDRWSNQNISALVVANDSTFYAATSTRQRNSPRGGIWKSTNRGGVWSHLPATTPTTDQSSTAINVSFRHISGLVSTKTGQLLAATDRGVLKSTDGGETWQMGLLPGRSRQDSLFNREASVRMSAIRLGNDSLVYVSTAAGRIFRSATAAATNWVDISPPHTGTLVGTRTELTVAPASSGTAVTIYAAQIVYDSTSGGNNLHGLFCSSNQGRTWQPINRPIYPGSPEMDLTLGFGDRYFSLTTHPDSSRVLYLTAYDQVYRSGDKGQTWTAGQFIDRAILFFSTKRGVIWGTDRQVFYGSDTETLLVQGLDEATNNRSKGFNGLAIAGVALKNTKNDPYRLVGSTDEPGLLELPGPGIQTEVPQFTYLAYPLRPFIDQDESHIELATTTDGGFITRNKLNGNSWDYYAPSWGNTQPMVRSADYDSRINTLYFWANGYKMATGLGSEQIMLTSLTDALPQPTCLKAGATPGVVYAATNAGQLYRITSTTAATPTSVRIDRGAFPAGGTISGIAVGATDSLLVVTLSNYGIQSVWLSTNAGTTWKPKDLPAYGLPDSPVNAVLLNPMNRRQVMLATEEGVWHSADITAATPIWTADNTNLPALSFSDLVYRSADGRVAVASNGRGVWETNAWSLTPTALLAGTLSVTSACVGTTLPLSFTLLESTNTPVIARLSDSSGDFGRGTIVGTASGTALTATLSTTLSGGNGYRIRLEAPELGLTTIYNNTLTINDLNKYTPQIIDRRTTQTPGSVARPGYTSGYVCPGDSALLSAGLAGWLPDSRTQYRWAIDGEALTDQQASTLLTGRTGTYSVTVTSGNCSVSSPEGFLLISINKPTLSVLNAPAPENGPLCSGTSHLLRASYSGQRGTYRWTFNNVAIPEASGPALSVTATGAYAYSFTLGESATSTCQALATSTFITFSQTILPSRIAVVNEVAPTLCGTESISLYATRQPDSTTYQWLRNGLPLPAQTAPSLTVADAGLYALRVGRGICSAVSSPISVSANAKLANGFYFYGSTTFCKGETLVLYVKNTAHSLQWTKNNVPIPGATGFSHAADSTGTYGLIYSTGSCSGTAAGVSVVVSQTLSPRLMLREQCARAELSTLDFPHSGTVTFSWLRNGLPLGQGQQAYRTVTESGLYSLSVTNGSCSGVSKPVSLTIGKPTKPVIQPTGNLIGCATSALVLASVSGPYSYWKLNGSRLPGSATEQWVAAQSGVYTLVYQQDSCLLESNPLSVTIGQPASATIVGRPYIQPGQSTSFTVRLTGMAPWSLSVVDGPQFVHTSQTSFTMSAAPTRSTSYSVINITDVCGTGRQGYIGRVFVTGADVSLQSWVNKRASRAGDSITYSVQVSNAGPDDAEDLVLLNRLPKGLSYVALSAADTLRHVFGNVPAGQSRTFSFATRVNRVGSFRNAVEVTSCATPDPDSRPNTGTEDGEDDATQSDWRTIAPDGVVSSTAAPAVDSTRILYSSPNPNAQVLPAVSRNQPPPVANRADLSLQMILNKRVVSAGKDTIQITLITANQGGLSTSSVQASLILPGGFYSLDRLTWIKTATNGTTLSLLMGTIAMKAVASRIVYWIPATQPFCRAEITRSAVLDADSTPNNRNTKPGEDDEAYADIRLR